MTVRLHTHVWNPNGRLRALLLHGLGSDGTTMWRIADHLAVLGFHVTAPDLRGHGLTPPTARYPLHEIAGDVAGLGGGWDLLVGHSLGGATAAVLLADAGFADAGVLIDPVLMLTDADKAQLLPDQLAEVGGALTYDDLRANQPGWSDEDVFRKVRASALVSRTVVQQVVADTDPWDLRDTVKRWSAPVTILAADPAAGALFIAEHLPDGTAAEVVTVQGAGHNVHRDAPEAVLGAIDARLAGGATRRAPG